MEPPISCLAAVSQAERTRARSHSLHLRLLQVVTATYLLLAPIVSAGEDASDASATAETTEVVSAIEDSSCFICHADPSLTKRLQDGSVISLYVDEEAYKHSIHATTTCVSCHADIEELPHQENLKHVDCSVCHVETEAFDKSLHGVALKAGDPDVSGCKDCHGTHDMRASTDPLSKTFPGNLSETCGKCHSNPALAKRHMISVAKPSDVYLNSVHAKAVAEGKHAATCSECHGSHDILPAHNPASPVFPMNIPATCGKCHAAITEEFKTSIHGKALAAGVKDAPNCTDCHGEHGIVSSHDKTSSVSVTNVSRSTCPSCHDDEHTMSRYGIPTNRKASYMDSYHGMASSAGSTVVASCTSCHGVHTILPSTDPASSVSKANLPQTCGKCHEDASVNFAEGPVHIVPTDPGQKALGIVRIVYLWVIALLLGGMVFHNTLLMGRHALSKLFVEWRGRDTHRRFSTGHVLGHMVLTVSFTALAISGFALRYPESWLMTWIFWGEGGLALRGAIHRISAVVFVVVTVVGMLYFAFSKHGRKELWNLMLFPQDVRDVLRNLAYAVCLSNDKPKFGRYSYKEKLEFWGLIWGSLLMIITGYCMWYADLFMHYWPKVALDVVALIHFYEAWLAVGTIVIWHLYYMIFDPETYPMNWSWITGKITNEDFKERHPLEYAEIAETAAVAEKSPGESGQVEQAPPSE